MVTIGQFLMAIIFSAGFWWLANLYARLRGKFRAATGGWLASLVVSISFRIASLALCVGVMTGSPWTGMCRDVALYAEYTAFAAVMLLILVFKLIVREGPAYGRW